MSPIEYRRKFWRPWTHFWPKLVQPSLASSSSVMRRWLMYSVWHETKEDGYLLSGRCSQVLRTWSLTCHRIRVISQLHLISIWMVSLYQKIDNSQKFKKCGLPSFNSDKISRTLCSAKKCGLPSFNSDKISRTFFKAKCTFGWSKGEKSIFKKSFLWAKNLAMN